MAVTIENCGRHVDFWKFLTKLSYFRDGDLAIVSFESLLTLFSFLGSEQAEPDAPHFSASGPEVSEVEKVAGAPKLRPSNRAMHRDLVALNVFENALISRG